MLGVCNCGYVPLGKIVMRIETTTRKRKNASRQYAFSEDGKSAVWRICDHCAHSKSQQNKVTLKPLLEGRTQMSK